MAEEVIKVLDHGYLRFVESWGKGDAGVDEAGIIEAARQSTQGSFRGWEKDERLLRFLFCNRPPHATPFEFAGMVIEVQAPIAVFREWHRHRTQCLAGDTPICCVSPRGTSYQRTIGQIYELKHGGVADGMPARHRNGYSKAGSPVTRAARRTSPWRVRVLPNCQHRLLRVADEDSGAFTVARMASVWESGVKEVFLLAAGDLTIKSSADHPFLTRDGWVKLRDLRPGCRVARMGKVAAYQRPVPPALRQGIGVWTTMMRTRLIADLDTCYLCGHVLPRNALILDHVIPVSESLLTALDERNLKPACVVCSRHKTDGEQPNREGMTRRGIRWEEVRLLPERVGEEMTYDLEVEGPHHNYVAGGFVVHNSYNEMSARYAPLPDLNYVPTPDRCLLAAGKNKQAAAVEGSEELTEVSALEWLGRLAAVYEKCEEVYQDGLRRGVPKELARLCLPVGRYSRMRACANLRNWLAFLTLRMDPNAQWEIRQYANALGEQVIARHFPRVWSLFEEGRRP